MFNPRKSNFLSINSIESWLRATRNRRSPTMSFDLNAKVALVTGTAFMIDGGWSAGK